MSIRSYLAKWFAMSPQPPQEPHPAAPAEAASDHVVAAEQQHGGEQYRVGSLLSDGVTFNGDLEVSGGIKIAGRVKGSVRCNDGAFVLAGEVTGDVYAEHAFIDGAVRGSLYARRVYLGEHAIVEGAIHYGAMQMQAGALVSGQMQQADASVATSQPSAKPQSRAAPVAPAAAGAIMKTATTH